MTQAPPADHTAERLLAVRDALPDHLARLAWLRPVLERHQRDALRTLLRHATDRSPFHAERLAGVDPDRFELDDLTSLPTMTKTEMMARFDDVVTDRRITRAGVERHLANTVFDAQELLGDYLVLASGGSSGERGVFVYSRRAAIDFLLAIVRPGQARMVAMLGHLPDAPPSLAMVAAGSGVHATRALASLFSGGLVSTHSVSATDPLDDIVGHLNALQPDLLSGYASVIRRLADEKLAGRLQIAPLSVTTTSEPLSPDARARIDEAFAVGVCNLFGSSEGVLGVSPPDDPAIVLASDLAIVELVDANGHPVPTGTPSAKVLVTNLFNTVQPLIRYEVTDSFVRHEDSPHDGHLRVSVDGRSDDELRYGAIVVHPLSVRSVMVKTPKVSEYQVRQTVRGIDVDVVASAPFAPEVLERRLVDALAAAGLVDAVVRVRAVDAAEIERHPETGKTRRFVTI